MIIWICNAIKINAKNQLHVQHTTNVKYKKYLHHGYKIQQRAQVCSTQDNSTTSKSI